METKTVLNIFRYKYFPPLIILVASAFIFTCGGNNNEAQSDPCDYNADITCGDNQWKLCELHNGDPDNFSILNNKLIFTATSGCNNSASLSLFEIDNSGAVNEVYEFISGDSSTIPGYPVPIVTLNNVAYFSWMGELYKYDSANPVQVIDEEVSAESLMAYSDKLYYAKIGDGFSSGIRNYDFYSYDGGSSVFIGEVEGFIGDHTVYNNKLYFLTDEKDLWCYDESTGALDMISGMECCPIEIQNFVIYQGKLYFNRNDSDNGIQLWMVDTENNVSMITSPVDIAAYSGFFIRPLTVFQGKLLCFVYTDSADQIFWEYDGENFNPIPVDASYMSDSDIITLNDRFYFLASKTESPLFEEGVLWAYDGLNAPAIVETNEYLREIYPYNGKLLLRTGTRLLIYDGNSQPESFANLGSLEMNSWDSFINLDVSSYVTGFSEEYGNELWKMDDTGTISLVKDFYPGIECSCEEEEIDM